MPRYAALILAVCLTSCAVSDSHTAKQARTTLIGMSEVDLESCVGTPDHKDKFGATEILTYNGASTSTGGVSLNLPILGTLSLAGGGYCHMTVRVDDGRATAVRYSGETDATFGPYAYCAPIVRECLRDIRTDPTAPAQR